MGAFRGVELDDLVIESERLLLRPWCPADADTIVAALSDPSMHTFLDLPHPYQVEAAQHFIRDASVERADGTGLECAVVATAGGELVGSATLRLPHRMRSCDIGYWIAPAAQGNGYATEVSRCLAGWAFDRGVQRVELRLDVRNIVSARVALAAGFGFEGVRREALRDESGARMDMAVFVRTATDPGDRIPPKFPALPEGGLSDGVLRLRSPLPEDIDGFAEQEADLLTLRTGFTGTPPPHPMMRRLLNRARLDHLVGPGTYFAMVDAATEQFAGSIRLRPGPPNVAGIGYAVHPGFRGRGFTSRALRLLSAWAFDEAGFARLELGAKIDNVASQRAAATAGFVPEGIWRARLRSPDGSFSDEARYALINPRHAPT